jgi:hypothetical protein
VSPYEGQADGVPTMALKDRPDFRAILADGRHMRQALRLGIRGRRIGRDGHVSMAPNLSYDR